MHCFLPFVAAASLIKAESPLQKEFSQLRKEHQKAISDATRAVDDLYRQTLNSLQKRANELHEADTVVAVRTELERLKKSNGKFLSLPQTAAELEKYLIDTTWVPHAEPNNPYTVNRDGRFVGREAQPTFKVTGRRTLTMFWGPTTHIPCVLSEDCSLMIEQAGVRHTFVRTERTSFLERKAASVEVSNMKAVPLAASGDDKGWMRVPEKLAEGKAIVFMPDGPTNGVADIKVIESGWLMLACNYDYQGNDSGEWKDDLWDEARFSKEAWQKLVKEDLGGDLLKANNRAQTIFTKFIKKGQTLRLRCNKHDPPYPILLTAPK